MDDESFIGDMKKGGGGGGSGGVSGSGGEAGFGRKNSTTQSRVSRIFHISPPVFRVSRPLLGGGVGGPAPGQRPNQGYAQPMPPPSAYSGSEERDTIGLAISRPRSEVTPRASRTSGAEAEAQGREPRLERKPSKLLPAKPALTLAIPSARGQGTAAGGNANGNENGPPSQQSQSQRLLQPPPTTTRTMTASDRASTMTNMTAFADLDSEAVDDGTQIWRPPPTDPQSATTYYVADRWGNWVLSGEHRRSDVERVAAAAELDTYTPLTKSPIERREEEEAAAMARAMSASIDYAGYGSGSGDRSDDRNDNGYGSDYPKKPQPAFLLVDPNDQSTAYVSASRSSSVYSQASAVRSRPLGPPPPARRRSSGSSRKASAYHKAISGSGGGVNRSDSQASATTINTSSSGPCDDETIIEDNDHDDDNGNGNNDGANGGFNISDIARLSQLSPVAESPSPISMSGSGNRFGGAGRTTGADGAGSNGPYGAFGARYPKIPGRLDGATIRWVPPPKRPNFSSSPQGQPSPTLGAVTPVVNDSPSAYPSPLRPSRPFNKGPVPAMPTSALSNGSGFSPVPTAESAFSQRQRQSQQQQQQQRPPPFLPRTPSPQIQRQSPPLSQDRLSLQQLQYQHPQQRQKQAPRPNPYPTPPSGGPPPPRLDTSSPATASGRQSPHIASQLTASTSSPMSTTTTASSAASSLLAKRVGSDKAAALALDPAGRQRAAQWRRNGNGGGGGGLLSPEMAAGLVSPRGGPMTSGTLPMTPTWQPKLTPTRRGDDLFLSVQ